MNEEGSTTYTVALATVPSGAVRVVPTVTGSSDVTVSPPSLDFTVTDWNVAQTVTVSAAEDADGDDETATVTHVATGADYEGHSSGTVTVLVADIDRTSRAVQLTVAPQEVSEGAGSTPVTVTAALDGAARAAPTEVTVTVSGATAGAGTDFAEVTDFTITIPADATRATGSFDLSPVDDDLDEGTGETVTVGGAVAAGTALTVRSATLTIADDDTRGIDVPQGPLAVTEEGGAATYTVALATQPTGDVKVRVAVVGNSDVTVDPEELTFTPDDWDTAQTVEVEAAHDDDGQDDTAKLRHTASGADYGGVRGDDLDVAVTDDDARGVEVSKQVLAFREGGSDTYTVRLRTRPTGTVTVTPTVDGDIDVTVTPRSLTFTTRSWSTLRTVTVRSRTDADPDDDEATVTHAVTGADYGENRVTASPVTVTVTDKDVPSTAIYLEVSADSVREDAGARTLTVTATLNAAPRGGDTEVELRLEADTAQAGTDFAEVGPVTLTIRAGSPLGTARIVLTPVRDDVDEENETVRITASTSAPLPFDPESLEVTIEDDDERGITLSRYSFTVREEASATYTVRLDSAPTGTMTVTPTVTGTSDVTVNPSVLTFDATDWSTAQTVTVEAAEDPNGDDEEVTIEHRASGADYGANGVTADPLSVTVDDIDQTSRAVQLTVAPQEVSEGAGSTPVTVTAALDGAARAAPTEVTVSVSGATAGAGTDFAEVTDFTITIPADATRATGSFDLSPVDDDLDEGTGETVTVGGAVAAGTALTVRSATLTIADDDTRGIDVPQGPLAVTEEGGAATYTVALATQPTGDVKVRVAVVGNSDVTVDPEELTFTPDDWDTAQTVEVEAAHDDDGQDDTAKLRHTASGADYGGVRGDDLDVAVTDDDARGVEVSKQVLAFREGGSDTYTVRLRTRPTGTVTVTPTVDGDSDVTVTPRSLTFTTRSWSTLRTVTVRSRTDTDPDDDEATVTHAVTGADYGENRVTASPVTVTVTDKDAPSTAIYLEVSADSVREDAGARTLTVTATLNAAPEQGDTVVTLALEGVTAVTGTDFAEVPPVTLTIAAGGARATARIVLTPVRDDVDEENETVRITASDERAPAVRSRVARGDHRGRRRTRDHAVAEFAQVERGGQRDLHRAARLGADGAGDGGAGGDGQPGRDGGSVRPDVRCDGLEHGADGDGRGGRRPGRRSREGDDRAPGVGRGL